MSDETKPPERAWIDPMWWHHRIGAVATYSEPETRGPNPRAAAYTLASSLPGSVEEIEELLKALRADEYKMTSSMRVRRALAAMRPRGTEEET